MEFYTKASGIAAIARKRTRGARFYPDFAEGELSKVISFHKSVDGYHPTPLHRLNTLAESLGVANIYVKDESFRFGLNAYKGLGGLYAVARVICDNLGLDIKKTTYRDLRAPENMRKIEKMVFVTATDGNHGNGLAWAATRLGAKSHVYMPRGSSEYRAQTIRNSGAESVVIADLLYDETVLYAEQQAKKNGWFLVQDTAWEGYTDIPIWISQGYTTLATEIYDELGVTGAPHPTHVFLQAGVGSLAGAITAYLTNQFGGHSPVIGIVEPSSIACIHYSVGYDDEKPHAITEESKTIMAGLNCGAPNIATWPILRDVPTHYFSCDDFVAAHGMRGLYHPLGNDPQIISGESGAVGLGVLSLLMQKDELKPLRNSFGLNSRSSVLLISTEGNTDPEIYDRIVLQGYCSVEA